MSISFNATGYNQGSLQISPDTFNEASSYLINKSGRVFYKKCFTLWQMGSLFLPRRHQQASHVCFNINFNTNVFRVGNMTLGEGLAFLLSSDLAPAPPGSHDAFLGLTNVSLNGNPDNHFIAV